MGWWKCSSEVFWSDVSNSIFAVRGRGEHEGCHRLYIFIQLLTISADNQRIQSQAELSYRTRTSERQCKIVWDVCIEKNVLRQDGSGWSAREWMEEQGLLPDTEISQNIARKTSSTRKASKTSSKPENVKIDAQKSQISTSMREVKEQVRPNVRLSRSEIEALKAQFTDEEISRMVDKLSEYKTNSGRTYTSDYQAIQRWVINWLKTPQKEQHCEPQTDPNEDRWWEDEEFMRMATGRK